ncbi:hypothetical protein VT84_15275 [Gemmata sp. SH-PL17]|uniref:hypothetical protein n=1 Tax=Gemmata sp. SH-PL17 TaxID=1630693 RepID=UPI0004B9C9CE|nr:hypothetical protein [Gemmata sp. SH-PL17]AMV25757.1 hypothetical protein VT84_15275 [Gemmata sp. SH-PL17]
MAERMSTRIRYDRIRDNSAISRTVNGHLKRKERANRDARMKKLITGGKFPYTPAVQSWLSEQLNVRFSEVTEAAAKDVASK